MATRKHEALTYEIIAKAIKRKAKLKLTDGGGMFLAKQSPNGTPTWRYQYRVNGKFISGRLGTWPEMSIEEARAAFAKARGGKPAATPAPAAPQAQRAKVPPVSQRDVFAAAGAAVELVESFGFVWNGARWLYLPNSPK